MIDSNFIKFNNYFKIYLILVTSLAIFFLSKKFNVGNDSTISEWLINYQGGFTRRGLLGEIFLWLSVLFKVEIRFVIFIFQSILYLSFIILFYFFTKKVKKNYLTVLSIFSPLLIVYHIAEIEVLARKELILFVHFLVLLLFKKKNHQIYYLAISTPIVLLIWEPVVFFSIFYFIVILFDLEKKDYKLIYILLILLIPSIYIILRITFNEYTNEDLNRLCENLLRLVNEKCYMSLGYLPTNIEFQFNGVISQLKITHVFRYFVALIIGFLPITIILLNSVKNNYLEKNFLNKNKLINLFLISSFPIIILFMMGQDWGRWCNIYYFYTIATFFYLYQKNLILFNWKKVKTKLLFLKYKNKDLSLLLFIVFVFSWNLKTLFKGDIGSLPLYRAMLKALKFLSIY